MARALLQQEEKRAAKNQCASAQPALASDPEAVREVHVADAEGAQAFFREILEIDQEQDGEGADDHRQCARNPRAALEVTHEQSHRDRQCKDRSERHRAQDGRGNAVRAQRQHGNRQAQEAQRRFTLARGLLAACGRLAQERASAMGSTALQGNSA